MAGKPAVKVTGAKELSKASRRMALSLSDLSSTNRSAGERVAASARSHAPRLTGRLRDSIKLTVERRQAVVTAGDGVPYAGPIHNGWPAHNISAQPFMDEAADDSDVTADYITTTDLLVRRWDRETP